MDVSVLGTVTVDGGAVALSPRDRVVLAALTCRVGEDVSTEELADALWGDAAPASWHKVVAGCVMRLRRVLGTEAIATTSAGYRLTGVGVAIDAHQFEQQVARAHQLLLVGEPDRAAHVFASALARWRGRPYADLEEWTPARIAAARLEEVRLDAEEALLAARLQAGPLWEVVGEAQARVSEAPLRERRWALLAQAQYRDGRQGDALATLRRARMTVAHELGMDPGAELVGLEQAILHQDPALLTGATYSQPSATCPYFGLLAAGVDDAETFFGRDEEVAACLRSLAEVGVLVVTGPSGIGKSSMVRAGVAARLRREGRAVSVVSPGARPMDALASVPRSPPAQALVVDQCEEALLLCDDVEEQRAFFAALAERADRDLLVVAIRADRLGDMARFPEFAALVVRNIFLLGPMSERSLRAVIERPAANAGLLLEPGLVEVLVRDVAGEPGALPLLSHALRQTWLRREGRTLTVGGYAATGGIRGAIAQSADQVYLAAPAAERVALRDLMLRLVEPVPDGDPVRLRVPRHLATTDPAQAALVERLVEARLLICDDGAVEMAHEALARNWPRLRVWLDEDVEGQRILRHLTMSATNWHAMGRPDAELYRGARLSGALAWRATTSPHLTETEQDFLRASAAQEEAELAAAQAQLGRERRRVGRLRVLIAAISVLAVLAGTAGLLAVERGREARGATRVAEAGRLGLLALRQPDRTRSLLTAVAAVRLDRSPETEASLLQALQRTDSPDASIGVGAVPASVAISPSGWVAVIDDRGSLQVFDDAGRRQLDVDPATLWESGPVVPVLAWLGEDYLAVGADDPPRVFRLDVRTSAASLLAPGVDPRAAGVTGDGHLLVALPPPGPDGARPRMLVVTDSATGERGSIRLPFAPTGLSVGGGPVAAVVADRSVAVIDLAAGRTRSRWPVARGSVVALSPDGSVLAVTGPDGGSLDLHAVRGAAATRSVAIPSGIRPTLTWSPDGDLIAVSDGAGSVHVLDAARGLPYARVGRGAGGSAAPVWAPTGRTLLTSDPEPARIDLWDLVHRRGVDRPLHAQSPPGVGRVTAMALDRASGILAVGTESGRVWLVDLDRDRVRVAQGGGEDSAPVLSVVFADDARLLLTADAHGVLTRWDAVRAVALGDVTGPSGTARTPMSAHAVVAPDGRTAASFSDGLGLSIVDVVTGERVRRVPMGFEPHFWYQALGWSADGSALVVRADDPFSAGVWALVSADTGQPVWTVVAPEDVGAPEAVVAEDVVVILGESGSPAFVNARAGDRGVPPIRRDADAASSSFVRPTTWRPGALAVSPDGQMVAAVDGTGTVTLWDPATGQPRATLTPGGQATARFRSDTELVAVDRQGAVVAYDLDPDHWIERACAAAGRDLTEEEWRALVPAEPYRPVCPGSGGLTASSSTPD